MRCRFVRAWDGSALDAEAEHHLQRVVATIEAAPSLKVLAEYRSLDLRVEAVDPSIYSIRVSDTVRLVTRVIDEPAGGIEVLAVAPVAR